MQTQPSTDSRPTLVPGPTKRHPRTWVKRYMPDQVNTVLRDYDSGMGAEAIKAKHQVSKATLYRWIAQYHDQVTVDNDPVCMRMRIATLEKTVLNLSAMLARVDALAPREAASEPLSYEADHATA